MLRRDRQAADAKPLDSEWVQEVAAEVLDTSQLGQRGEAWFAAQAVLLLLVVVPPEPLRPLLSTVGWLATAAGLGLVVAGQQALGTNLTPLPQPRKSATLSTGGIFGYVRHPMYGGLVLAALGYGLASGDELRLLMAIALFFVLDAKVGFPVDVPCCAVRVRLPPWACPLTFPPLRAARPTHAGVCGGGAAG